MLKLAFLLIGPAAFRARWHVLAVLGVVLLGFGAVLVFHASPIAIAAAYGAAGVVFLAVGLISCLAALVAGERLARRLGMLQAGGSALVGALFLAAPFANDWWLAWFFAAAFALDGATRLFTTLLFRFAGWRTIAGCGLAELLLAAMILADWPLPHAHTLPLCVGLLVCLSGWLVLRLGLLLRGLEGEAAILLLPVFAGRGWYEHAPVLVGDEPPRLPGDGPLIVHVWTPAGAGNTRERRPVIDRYLGVIGADGVLSTGHTALEMPPDLYISHYPAPETKLHGRGVEALHAGAHNDLPGYFLPSHQAEVDDWCPADARVLIHNFSPRRLRAFWAGYRQDTTYNLANRNCSTLVAAALDAALEGALATPRPWLRLGRLLVNPDLWALAMVRSRAMSMTWTPGLVLDYARLLARLVDRRERRWRRRLDGFLARLRPETEG